MCQVIGEPPALAILVWQLEVARLLHTYGNALPHSLIPPVKSQLRMGGNYLPKVVLCVT
jgi:hypothetical protein